MRTAYFDCFSGASGDMILAALLEAGLEMEHLESELAKLGLPHYALRRQRVARGGIRGTRLIVDIDECRHHCHRNLEQIENIIFRSELDGTIKDKSVQVFRRLAEAEAAVHAEAIDHVHFHEVGALDAIVDIVGAIAGLAALGIERVHCSPIHVGTGTVKCAHGVLPVPAPATAELLRGVPFYATAVVGELLTPTGAAILTTMASDFGPMPPLVVERVGYGAGTRELPIPNLLRLFVGVSEEPCALPAAEQVAVLETNIDDMSPQIYEYVMNKMLDLGALEIFLSPAQMKKNRPGTLITVICRPALVKTCAEFLVRETTSIGLRWRYEYKFEARKEMGEVQTSYGSIRFKVARIGDRNVNVMPEYEDCKRIALELGVPLKDVMESAKRALPAVLGAP